MESKLLLNHIRPEIRYTIQSLSSEIEKSIAVPLESSRLLLPTISQAIASRSERDIFPNNSYPKRYKRFKNVFSNSNCLENVNSNNDSMQTEVYNRNLPALEWINKRQTDKISYNTHNHNHGMKSKNENYNISYLVCSWLIGAVICSKSCRILLRIASSWKIQLCNILYRNKACQNQVQRKICYGSILTFPFFIVIWIFYIGLWVFTKIFDIFLHPVPYRISQCINLAAVEYTR